MVGQRRGGKGDQGERGFPRYFNNGCVSHSPKTFLCAAVILTHTSSAFDADESKGGNGVLGVDCRCKGVERGLANAQSSSRFANAQGA